MALLLTCGDGEERGEVYGCAADRQQASIVFEGAADMVRMCPALNKRVKILASQKRIVCPEEAQKAMTELEIIYERIQKCFANEEEE